MPRIRYIGNLDFLSEGKFLLEILAQLRNFGVGRLVTKEEWKRKWPDQASYCIVKRVEAQMDRWFWKGTVWAEWIYRGHNLGLHEFSKDLDKSDWKLIHKHNEKEFTAKKTTVPLEYRIPSQIPLPPLQALIWKNKQHSSENMDIKEDEVPMIPTVPYIDPEHNMLRPYIKLSSELNASSSQSIYSTPRESYLDLYGKELPVKVENWDN